MNKEDTLSFLYKFVDHYRDNLRHPFSQELKIGKYLIATDAKMVLLIPETEENKIEVLTLKPPPDVNRILPEFTEGLSIDFNYLLGLYNDIPIIELDVTDSCESCDGLGSFNHYRYDYKCKKCDATGQIKTGITQKSKNPNTVFRFHTTDIPLERIQKLIYIFEKTKSEPKLEILKLNNNMGWFRLGNILIGAVAQYDIENDDIKWDVVNVNMNAV